MTRVAPVPAPTPDEDQAPWVPPEGRGLVAHPFVEDDPSAADPVRPGRDPQTRRMRAALLFALVLFVAATGLIVQFLAVLPRRP